MAGTSTDSDPLAGNTRYRKVEALRDGGFGSVIKAIDLEDSGKLVAIKLLDRSKGTITKSVTREVLNHSSLTHPNIIKFRDLFVTDQHLAIVMDFAAAGDLYSYAMVDRDGLPEDIAAGLFKQLLFGLDYCHRKGIRNRDIKLDNMLLDPVGSEMTLKICDFGLSIHDRSPASSGVGTQPYFTPEVLAGSSYDAKPVDIWSAGVMLYAMLFARFPFQRDEDFDLPDEEFKKRERLRIVKGDYKFPQNIRISESCKELLSRMLVLDPKERITIAEMWQHHWVQEAYPRNLDINDNELCITDTNEGLDQDAIRAVLEEAKGGIAEKEHASDVASDHDGT